MSGRLTHPVLIAGMFAAALLPLLSDYVLFHPDERHYVDSGLEMLASGDWLTPRTPAGDVRLYKPVLAYWCVAAGNWLWGTSPFSSRILFLVAAAVLVWCGGRAARNAGGCESAVRLTAIMLALHPVMLVAATRSLPDVLLALGITISLGGCLQILHSGRVMWGPLLAAAGGGAMAILSKGAPGAAFVVYGTAFLLVREPRLVRANLGRCLLATVLCLGLTLPWFAVMLGRHGPELIAQFGTDQGGAHRFVGDGGQLLLQLGLCVVLMAGSFAALLLPALGTLWQRAQGLRALLARPVSQFLIGWMGLYVALAACINHVSPRYLLPVVPAGAILLGRVLAELESPLLRQNLRRLAWASLALPVLAAGLTALVWRQTAPIATGCAVLGTAGVCVLLVRQMRYTGLVRSMSVVWAASLTAVFLLTTTLAAAVGPSFGQRVTETLDSVYGTMSPLPTLTLIGEPAHAARIRVCAGGRLPVRWLPKSQAATVPLDGPVAVMTPTPTLRLTEPAQQFTIPCGLDEITLLEACRHLWQGSFVHLLQERQRTYLLVVPARHDAPPHPEADLPTRWALQEQVLQEASLR